MSLVFGSSTQEECAKLKVIEERQRLALEAADGGTWDLEAATGRLVCSDIFVRLLGARVGPMAPTLQWWLQLVDRSDRQRVEQTLKEVLRRKSPEFRVEFRVRHQHKGERWIQASGRVTFGNDGQAVRIAGVTLDVSDRHRAEEALQDSNASYQTLFEMAPVGIIMVEPEHGEIVAFNSRATEMLGYTRDEFTTMRLADVEVALDEDQVRQSLAEISQSAETAQFQTRHKHKDGRTLEVLAAAHRVNVGGAAFVYKMWMDITELKAVERQLDAARVEAERADRAKSEFLAAASHDLRQPVQSLLFFHSALVAKLKAHPATPLLHTMRTSLDALRTILDGLLDISKLRAGVIEVQPTAFPVAALLARLENDYAGQAHEKGLDFRVVPSSAWVRSDMALLERILRNLIDNAIKYTAHGGILVGCRRQRDGIRLDVVDTGSGIPAGKQNEIFHEFVQLGNPERDRARGLGLGLAIVRHLGQLLGHPITVQSRPGHGTTFSVTLPSCKPRVIPRTRAQRPPSRGAGRGGVALVVDDESLVLVGMRALLEGMGWEVLAAASGEEAKRLVLGHRIPDVIVADYRLRGEETGINVIRDITGICGLSIPAVVLTGDTTPERIQECQNSGFRLLHKPITAQALQATLGEMRRKVG